MPRQRGSLEGSVSDLPSQVHWAPGVSMLDAPIFNIKLLFVANLLAFALAGSGATVESTATAVDFFHQRFLPASALLNRRAETRKAASEDGMLGKARIWQMSGRCKGKGERGKGNVKGCNPDQGLETSSVCRSRSWKDSS